VLDEALPMIELLWRRETGNRVFDSPERKAALEKALREATAGIRDGVVRRHYEEEIRRLLWERVRRADRGTGKGARLGKGGTGASPAMASPLAAGARAPEDEPRRAVLALLFVNPELIPTFVHEIEGLDCPEPDEAALRDALLLHVPGADLRAAVEAEVGAERLEAILGAAHILQVRKPGDHDAVRLDVAEALAKLAVIRTQAAEILEAMEEINGTPDERLTVRLAQVAAAADPTRRREAEDTRETVVFGNGLAVDKEEKERRDRVFAQIDLTRGGRGGHRRGP
jgi:DNA primase